MAINPNTDFVAGGVLTAAQQNRFPRGIVSIGTTTSADTTVTAEEVMISPPSFTAVANRYYKITYFEPNIIGGTGYFTFRIRQSNISGTILNTSYNVAGSGVDRQAFVTWVGTFAAGTTNVVATAAMSAGTGTCNRSSGVIAYLIIEDIGPA